jgi:carbon monoxide dehydrogenase subunit G
MVRRILIGVGVIIVALVVVVATRPADFHVERSTTVAAPADRVFAQVNDFHSWPAWSPWEKLDPQMARTHSGAPAGVGAMYGWKSENSKVGEGRMTIEKSERPSQVGVKLEFIKPFTATNTVTFTMAPEGTGTKVTWAMDGHQNFMGKAASLAMNMDKMVGGDFERGLASLKTVAESAAAAVPPTAAAP